MSLHSQLERKLSGKSFLGHSRQAYLDKPIIFLSLVLSMPSVQSDSISKFFDQYIKGSIICLDIHLKKIIQIKMNSHSKYNFNAQPPKSQRQSIFMVKLTESAELCLENYLLPQGELKCPCYFQLFK